MYIGDSYRNMLSHYYRTLRISSIVHYTHVLYVAPTSEERTSKEKKFAQQSNKQTNKTVSYSPKN